MFLIIQIILLLIITFCIFKLVIKRRIKSKALLIKRNNAVLDYRKRVLDLYPVEVYYNLQSYHKMLYSSKELTNKNWIPKEFQIKYNIN